MARRLKKTRLATARLAACLEMKSRWWWKKSNKLERLEAPKPSLERDSEIPVRACRVAWPWRKGAAGGEGRRRAWMCCLCSGQGLILEVAILARLAGNPSWTPLVPSKIREVVVFEAGADHTQDSLTRERRKVKPPKRMAGAGRRRRAVPAHPFRRRALVRPL